MTISSVLPPLVGAPLMGGGGVEPGGGGMTTASVALAGPGGGASDVEPGGGGMAMSSVAPGVTATTSMGATEGLTDMEVQAQC